MSYSFAEVKKKQVRIVIEESFYHKKFFVCVTKTQLVGVSLKSFNTCIVEKTFGQGHSQSNQGYSYMMTVIIEDY